MPVCDFRHGKAMGQRNGIKLLSVKSSGKFAPCCGSLWSNAALIAVAYEDGGDNVQFMSSEVRDGVQLGLLCGRHFDSMLNEIGAIEKYIDMPILDGNLLKG